VRELLLQAAQADPSRPAVVAESEVASWAELAALAEAYARVLAPLRGARVGVRLAGSAGCWAALAALDAVDAAVVLLDAGLGPDACHALAGDLGLFAIVTAGGAGGRPPEIDPAGAPPPPGPPPHPRSVTILTSGTTGRPKPVRHTWESLARPVRRSGGAPGTWLVAYRPSLYAGLQVALQALAEGGTLVVPPRGAPPAAVARLMAEHRVDCASGTASWWRRLLLFAGAEVARAPLRQVTLGGELVDQQVLDGLARLFPSARIVHVYATTELGRCFSVADRRAGFPAAYLGAASPDGVELRVVDGELHVRSANAVPDDGAPGARPRGALVATGDLVEVRGDRVHFVGRRSDVINVGGNKVHPAEVERVLRSVPGLGDVRVYARPSSIAGELVACDVVPAPGADPAALRAEIARRCAAGLLAFQRPRVIQVVGEIAVSASGKVVRRAPR
jgi:acyl-CoA synthetase (AMP-forming)/AMP-acid ligase II